MKIDNKKKPKPSLFYSLYWHFAAESQEIFFKKIMNVPFPLTEDKILNENNFKNVYRASNPNEQYLIKSVIYKGNQSANEVFFRVMLFRVLNDIKIWKGFEKEIGTVSYEGYSLEKYDVILTGFQSKIDIKKIILIEKMIKDCIPQKLSKCKSFNKVCLCLSKYLSIDEQTAFNLAIDLNYSDVINFSEMEFVNASDNAKMGISKCFLDNGDFSEDDIIQLMVYNQEKEFNKLGINFKSLWGRSLQLIDCENLFSELNKYISLLYERDLQQMEKSDQNQKTIQQLEFWFPPKWGINDRINQ